MVIELFFQHKMDGHLPTHPVNGSLVSWLKQMGQSFIISIISGIILPIDEVIFFKMAIAPPTSCRMLVGEVLSSNKKAMVEILDLEL